MSEDPIDPQRPPPRWLRPRWFLAGFALGLAALGWLGWSTACTDYHPGFRRFTLPVSPETSYYPTLDEMTAIVREQCHPGQILVIVGGNSILQGVWQPVADLWSARLQELLGDRYCVINFAFRGGSPADGGAVVAEVLRNEFPRQILIANEAPLNGVDLIGNEHYRWLFWEAYIRGLLMDTPERTERVQRYLKEPGHRREWVDTAIEIYFDRAFHDRDLWNRICFEDFCTVPSLLGESIPDLLTPRCQFPDNEGDATIPEIRAQRYPVSVFDIEMQIVRGTTVDHYRRGPGGNSLNPAEREAFAGYLSTAFPVPLKPRTLILISQNSPYYRRHLNPEEQALDDQGYAESVQMWRSEGYPAMEYGRDFNDDDFGDRIHLSKLGGAKLAEAVAPEVRSIAEKLGYLR